MRLFYAITFSTAYRRALDEIAAELAAQAVFARRVPPENYHLTLAFLGEQANDKPFIKLLDTVSVPAFTLKSGRAGYFQRSGGGVYWLGIQERQELKSLRRHLAAGLREHDLHIEGESFRPHVTLLRDALMPADFDLAAFNGGLAPLSERADAACLMLSTREAGKLVYRELHRKSLA